MLSNKGSIYFHIDYKIGHYIKIIMDEIFGVENFVPLDELKPINSFQQTFLDRVKAGKTLYTGYGYILK